MEEWVQNTIDAFKDFIDRPPMEQKHLTRPPFMFIVQTFNEVTLKTGFGKGLLESAELTKEYYTDPQKKLTTLKKMILLVRGFEGKFEISPENIVRGTECEKTNVFLQKLAAAAKKKPDTSGPVSKILDKISGKNTGGDDNNDQNNSNVPQTNTAQMGGHQREVADLTKGARISAPEHVENDPGAIRMGTLNRAGRTNSRVVPSTTGGQTEKTQDTQEQTGQAPTTIEGLKDSIQSITQSINPMGKIIQFLDDDVESMKREFDNWAKIYSGAKEQLEDKEKAIEAELQPYKDKIVAKEEQIREKKGQIDSLKSKILRNNLKIKKLLTDIVGAN